MREVVILRKMGKSERRNKQTNKEKDGRNVNRTMYKILESLASSYDSFGIYFQFFVLDPISRKSDDNFQRCTSMNQKLDTFLRIKAKYGPKFKQNEMIYQGCVRF